MRLTTSSGRSLALGLVKVIRALRENRGNEGNLARFTGLRDALHTGQSDEIVWGHLIDLAELEP